jgi:hypothetical protein
MARTFDNNTANYMSRASVNLGLNGLTECSYAYWVKFTASTGVNQRLLDRESGGSGGTPFRSQMIDISSTIACSVANSGGTQTPDWEAAKPANGVWTRVLFTFKRNAITSADGIIYYNGVSQTITTFTAGGYAAGFTLGESAGNFFYGLRVITNALPLNAAFSWVCVWNRQLTPQEAYNDFLHPLHVTSGLVHRVQIAPDTDGSGNGNDMTVNGTLVASQGAREELVAWMKA